jgi:hypothetical protein
MKQRKIRPKAHIKRFLKDNKKFIKELGGGADRTEAYSRDPWMTKANPIDDRYEEFLYKESDSL